MPIGDDAAAAGYALVPGTELVRLGAQEINLTRDYCARVKNLIPSIWPVTSGGTGGDTPETAREGLGIYQGTSAASDTVAAPVDGTIYFKIIGLPG